jgi:hypothetical protein
MLPAASGLFCLDLTPSRICAEWLVELCWLAAIFANLARHLKRTLNAQLRFASCEEYDIGAIEPEAGIISRPFFEKRRALQMLRRLLSFAGRLCKGDGLAFFYRRVRGSLIARLRLALRHRFLMPLSLGPCPEMQA